MLNRKRIGVVGVDSGQVLICDPCYLRGQWKGNELSKEFGRSKGGKNPEQTHEFSYDGCCRLTCFSKEQGGQLNYELGHPGAGVVACSGYGDGLYPVYAYYNREGRIMKLVITFD